MYVDDIILARHSDELIQDLVVKLEKEFALKDLGELHNFLGVEVRHFDRGIFLSQWPDQASWEFILQLSHGS